MSKSYLNGKTNSLDDYLYTCIDENENLCEENPTVKMVLKIIVVKKMFLKKILLVLRKFLITVH